MIAEILPEYYDVQGRRVFTPGRKERRAGFRPTLPMGRNLTQPLKIHCKDFEEMRTFLRGCRAHARDPRHPKDHRQEHWQAPEEFEQTKTGNCVAFSIWAWRQLLDMGYKARFTGGKAGKFGEGHAWVTFEIGGEFYLLDPQRWYLGLRMPVLSALRYHPSSSVEWDGKKICYYSHEDRRGEPPLSKLPALMTEWLAIYGRLWLKVLPRIPVAVTRKVFRVIAARFRHQTCDAAQAEAANQKQ